MEKQFIFKESELVHIITELGRLPYNQVCRIINFIDVIASKQPQPEKPKIEEQIDQGIVNSQSDG